MKFNVVCFNVIQIALLCIGCVSCCTPKGRFMLGTDSDLLNEEITVSVLDGVGDLACIGTCHRSSSCIASVWDKVAEQCRFFASYHTLNTSGWGDATSKIYILENPCGPLRDSVSEIYTKNAGLVTTRVVCNESEYFYGTDQMTSCDISTNHWTQTGECITQIEVVEVPGSILFPVNSSLIIDATLTGDRFTVTMTSTGTGYYAIKIVVEVSAGKVSRNSKVDGAFQDPELSIPSEFPFNVGIQFIMRITSTTEAFVVNIFTPIFYS